MLDGRWGRLELPCWRVVLAWASRVLMLITASLLLLVVLLGWISLVGMFLSVIGLFQSVLLRGAGDSLFLTRSQDTMTTAVSSPRHPPTQQSSDYPQNTPASSSWAYNSAAGEVPAAVPTATYGYEHGPFYSSPPNPSSTSALDSVLQSIGHSFPPSVSRQPKMFLTRQIPSNSFGNASTNGNGNGAMISTTIMTSDDPPRHYTTHRYYDGRTSYRW